MSSMISIKKTRKAAKSNNENVQNKLFGIVGDDKIMLWANKDKTMSQ